MKKFIQTLKCFFIKAFVGRSFNATQDEISKDRLKIGEEIELDMGQGKLEKVTVSKITPHDCVKGSVYYEFSNGQVCRDVRLH